MIRFKYRYCQVHMARFVSGDLSEAARRRVGRYIDECEACHREYIRHRDFAQKLERNLPALGAPKRQRLDELWTSLQGELQAPAKQNAWLRDFASANRLQFSYGLVMLAISILLLLPIAVGFHATLSKVDLPRVPQVVNIESTPDTLMAEAPMIMATAQPRWRGFAPRLQNTPAPDL